MIAVDTNVLARALVEDANSQAQSTAAQRRLQKEPTVFVSTVVQVELVWLLESAFDLPKAEVGSVLDHLHDNTAFQLENEPEFSVALAEFKAGTAGFADCLILAVARAKNAMLVTFDKRLARADGAQLLAAA